MFKLNIYEIKNYWNISSILGIVLSYIDKIKWIKREVIHLFNIMVGSDQACFANWKSLVRLTMGCREKVRIMGKVWVILKLRLERLN